MASLSLSPSSAEFHPAIVGMTGTPQQIKALVQRYKVFFSEPTEEDVEAGDYIVDHSIATFMFDPQVWIPPPPRIPPTVGRVGS